MNSEPPPQKAHLEEDRLPVLALGAAHGLGARQRGVGCHILEHLGALVGAVVDLVAVDAVALRSFGVVAVPARVQEDLLQAIFGRVQDVVALSAELHGTHGGRGPEAACAPKDHRGGRLLQDGDADGLFRFRLGFALRKMSQLIYSSSFQWT